jgi:hypothetical protein
MVVICRGGCSMEGILFFLRLFFVFVVVVDGGSDRA